MKGCLAPSEIPGLAETEVSRFGNFAEDLISSEYRLRRGFSGMDVYIDNNNPAPYWYFIVSHNPQFSIQAQKDYYTQAYLARDYRRPDILIHTFAEKAFYEIKPDSTSGRQAGVEKVGILTSTYAMCRLPYLPGFAYSETSILVASAGPVLRVHLRAKLQMPGLIVYRICLESAVELDVVTLAILLRFIVRELNRQSGSGSFRPVDLGPAFAREGQLNQLARTLGMGAVAGAAGAAAVVGWKYFWKAVAKKFAVRGATMAALSVADGPLPVGELISIGIAVWTVVDIIRLSDELWNEAAQLQRAGA